VSNANLALEFSSPRDGIEIVLIFTNPPDLFDESFEFEVGKDFENTSEFDLSIT